MNKFYILSAVLHGAVILCLLGFAKDEELKFKEKNTMVVSVKNRKAVSNNSNISIAKENEKEKESENEKKEEEKNIVEEKTVEKEIVEEKIVKEKATKIVKKEEIKEKSKKNKDLKNKKIDNSESKSKSSEEKKVYNEFEDKNRFLQGEDGVFTAASLDGIEYEILKEVDPQYPMKAKKIGYSGMGSVKVKFLVDVDGSVKDIEFISGESKFGFREEVEKALKKWKFKPIVYKGKVIKVHFEKEFKFKKN